MQRRAACVSSTLQTRRAGFFWRTRKRVLKLHVGRRDKYICVVIYRALISRTRGYLFSTKLSRKKLQRVRKIATRVYVYIYRLYLTERARTSCVWDPVARFDERKTCACFMLLMGEAFCFKLSSTASAGLQRCKDIIVKMRCERSKAARSVTSKRELAFFARLQRLGACVISFLSLSLSLPSYSRSCRLYIHLVIIVCRSTLGDGGEYISGSGEMFVYVSCGGW